MNNDRVTYYVVFDEYTIMKEVVEAIMKDNSNIVEAERRSSAGNGCMIGAVKYRRHGKSIYELHLGNSVRDVDVDLFDIIFSVLPNKEYCICLNKYVFAPINQSGKHIDGTIVIDKWDIDILTDEAFNPLPLIRVTGDVAIDAIVFNEHRPILPGGKWYSEANVDFSDSTLSTERVKALLRKHRFD